MNWTIIRAPSGKGSSFDSSRLICLHVHPVFLQVRGGRSTLLLHQPVSVLHDFKYAMRKFLLISSLIFLVSCGTASSLKSSMAIPTSTSFQFVDNRPPEQRLTRQPTPSDDEFYFGDDAIDPSAPDILRATLERHRSAIFQGKVVTLDELVVSVKTPAVSVDRDRVQTSANSIPGAAAIAPVVAPLAGLLVYGIESARSKKWVYVRVRGRVGDKEFSAYQNDAYSGRVTEVNVLATLQTVVDAAAVDAERAATVD